MVGFIEPAPVFKRGCSTAWVCWPLAEISHFNLCNQDHRDDAAEEWWNRSRLVSRAKTPATPKSIAGTGEEEFYLDLSSLFYFDLSAYGSIPPIQFSFEADAKLWIAVLSHSANP
jgi:hypothetical protein